MQTFVALQKTLAICMMVGLLGFSGCVNHSSNLTLASTADMDWPTLVIAPDAEGEACTARILGFRRSADQGTLEAAIDQAIENVPDAQLLTAVKVQTRAINLLIFQR